MADALRAVLWADMIPVRFDMEERPAPLRRRHRGIPQGKAPEWPDRGCAAGGPSCLRCPLVCGVLDERTEVVRLVRVGPRRKAGQVGEGDVMHADCG